MTDDEIDSIWLYRTNIHNGELMPQLRDFARALLAAQPSQAQAAEAVGYYWIGDDNRQKFYGSFDTIDVETAKKAQLVYLHPPASPVASNEREDALMDAVRQYGSTHTNGELRAMLVMPATHTGEGHE